MEYTYCSNDKINGATAPNDMKILISYDVSMFEKWKTAISAEYLKNNNPIFLTNEKQSGRPFLCGFLAVSARVPL